MFGATLTKEALVRTIDDADFGRLEFWRTDTASKYSLNRKWRSDYEWRGAVDLPSAKVVKLMIVSDDETDANLGYIGAEPRAAFCTLIADEAGVRMRAAQDMLDLAKSWAAASDLPVPSVESLAAAFQLTDVDIYSDAVRIIITFWFDETAKIFAGHVIAAEFNAQGEMVDVGIHG